MDVSDCADLKDDVQVVDVREQDEWDTGHLEGSVHIPLDSLSGLKHRLEPGLPVLAVCRTGARSQKAAELLHDAGFEVDSLEGGLRAWVAAGHGLVDSEGNPGSVLERSTVSDQPPEFTALQGALIEVAYGLQERYGNREPTDEEARTFMREWLAGKGHSAEEIERILADGAD